MLKRRLLLKMMKKRSRSLMTKKEKKSRNTLHLPEDLLVEILSRVPEASLARFRSTSKGWNALIKKDGRLAKNSLFVMLIYRKVYLVKLNLHAIHDNKVEKVISKFSLSDPLSRSSLKEVDIRRVCHCDGLLLCTTMDGRLVVWNPCSGETSRIIERSYSGFYTYALGKSSCNNEYKILRVKIHVYGYWLPSLVEYGIYDFISNSWRVVGETRDWYIPSDRQHGTTVDGNTYWLTRNHSPTGTRNTAS
ncbi:putative F-box protein [Raphanus sativus]|uniref:F-box protein At4g10190 n=1 Tax=Raphanus sativus TaxID=3726 RepID=A0A9W3DSG6_RAPSA|nr:putative F-box protein At4g10190 [Raphanus sativus]KAJ4894186.1 putative F-box protein [Raphanus sativus]